MPEVLVCSGCNVEIEQCEFCDDDDCAVAICYGCVIVDLGETMAEPHAHGG